MIVQQKIVYVVGCNHYDTQDEAEAAVFDMVGEKFDSLLKECEEETGRPLRFQTWNISFVEKLIRDREKLAYLLGYKVEKDPEVEEMESHIRMLERES